MQQFTIHITLVDGTVIPFPSGITGLEIAQYISAQLTNQVLAVLVDGEVWDATRAIQQDASVQLLTWKDEAGKSAFWHSSAHLLAEALVSLYPGIQLGTGPAIDRGFYYDVDFGVHDFDMTHLPSVEAKMLTLAKQKHAYQRTVVNKEEAVKYFQQKESRYKLELLEGLEDGQITFYKQGDFTDLCRGPHIPHTGLIKAVKLLNIAGAYWRGDTRNKQLVRIYGITFPRKKELEIYLTLLEEAKARNHQKIGKELGIFTFSENVGIGLPLWLPKGVVLRNTLETFLRDAQDKAGYQPVVTPHIGRKELYVTSGHYEKYSQDSFQPIQSPHIGEEFLLKPMNCPHHCELYKSEPRSYRDLPVRFAEFGTVYRYEQHGELHGLARTRCFTQDDAHIFCLPDQVVAELERVIDLILYVFKRLTISIHTVQLSLRDPKKSAQYIGKEQDWEQAEAAMEAITVRKGLQTTKALGEAAFYGPKLDFMCKDALGRNWQLGTVQLDYQLPERFNLTYTGKDNKKYTPVLIHRAPFGSLERFIALLIEHTGGRFPFWLAPEQAILLPISEKYAAYADHILQMLLARHIRVTINHRDEKIGKKVKHAMLRKIPYMLIVGEKELLENKVAVRSCETGDQGIQSIDALLAMFDQELVLPAH